MTRTSSAIAVLCRRSRASPASAAGRYNALLPARPPSSPPLERAHPCKRLIVTDVRAPDAQHHPPGQRLSKSRPVERIQKAGTAAQTHHPWLRTHEANLPTLNIHVRPGPKSTTTGEART